MEDYVNRGKVANLLNRYGINAIACAKLTYLKELYEMGLIDALFNATSAIDEVYSFIKKLKKSNNTRKAVLEIRKRINPVTFEEMLDVGHIWVDAAMRLTDRELKTMERLIRSQDKIAKTLSHTREMAELVVQPIK